MYQYTNYATFLLVLMLNIKEHVIIDNVAAITNKYQTSSQAEHSLTPTADMI